MSIEDKLDVDKMRIDLKDSQSFFQNLNDFEGQEKIAQFKKCLPAKVVRS